MVNIKVAGSGQVKRVSVKSATDKSLGRCVARAVRAARFNESQNGARFNYPFVF